MLNGTELTAAQKASEMLHLFLLCRIVVQTLFLNIRVLLQYIIVAILFVIVILVEGIDACHGSVRYAGTGDA